MRFVRKWVRTITIASGMRLPDALHISLASTIPRQIGSRIEIFSYIALSV